MRRRRDNDSLRGLPAALALLACLVGCSDGDVEPVAAGGRQVFDAFCAACHHPEGLGVDGGGPPLAGSSWVAGPEGRLVRIVLHGVTGSIEVAGRTYDREMLGFGAVMTDEQIAGVLTWVRRRFAEGAPPISPETVARIRAESGDRHAYWTVQELLEIR